MRFYSNTDIDHWVYIELYQTISELDFSCFREAPTGFSKICCQENQQICVLLDHYAIVAIFPGVEKTRIGMSRKSVQKPVREFPSDTISCIFG